MFVSEHGEQRTLRGPKATLLSQEVVDIVGKRIDECHHCHPRHRQMRMQHEVSVVVAMHESRLQKILLGMMRSQLRNTSSILAGPTRTY